MAAKLYYADGRGRAEIIRIILAVADAQYTEVDFTEKQQWEDMKKSGRLLFNQVPMLEIDGYDIVQSGTIVRYLARKYKLFGTTDEETIKIDMYFEGTRDFYSGSFLPLVFMDEKECLQKAKDVMMPKYLPVYEKILETSGGNFLVGNALSIADLGLLEVLLAIEEFFGIESFDSYPKLKAYYQKLKSMEKISTFLNGPQRKKKNDAEYVAMVKRILY